jgi:PAS domain S-box-containing protein/putative nucleotidyltransferase with HDIG domain
MAASELESLYRLSLRLGATLDRRQESALFLEWTQAEAQPRLAVLFAADESRRSLCLLAAHGLDAEKKAANLLGATLPIGLDPWKWLHKSGARLPRSAARQRYSLPIILEGELMGLLCVVSARKGAALQDEQRLLELGLAHLAPVLRNIERYESMEQLVQQRTQALAASEERYRIISEMISDYAYAFRVNEDQTMTREWVIGGFEAITGYTSQELDALGGWQVLVYPEDMPIALARARRLLANQHDVSEFRIRRKDGAIRWLRDHGHPIWDATQGRVTRIYGAAQDITQRKLAEEASRAAEARLRALIEQVPAVVFTTAAENDRLLFISPQIEALSGYPVEQWLSEPNFWRKLIHPEDFARVRAEEQRTSASGEPFRIECRMIARDGRIVWLRDEAVLIRDPAGKPAFWQGVMLDITERKQREREIETQALLAQALSETLELQPLLERLLQAALHAIPTAEKGSVALLADEAHLQVRAIFGYHSPNVLGFTYPIQRGYAGRALRERRPLLIQDLQQDADLQKDAQQANIAEVQALRSAIAVPLLARGAVIGALSVESSKANSFSETDMGVLVSIASTAALVIERARLYEEAQQRLSELSVLHRASQILLMARPDPESTYAAVHQAAASVMPCEAFAIVLEDEVLGDYHGVYLYDKSGRHPPQHIPRGKGLSGQVIPSGKTLLINDYPIQSEVQAVHFGDPQHVRSILAVPLRRDGRTFGMISAQSYQPNAYNESHQRLLETLAAQFAASIENARLFEQTQRQAQKIAAVNAMGRALAASLDLPTIYRTAYQHVRQLVNCDNLGISLFDQTANTLRAVYILSDGEELDVSSLPPLVFDPQQALNGRAKAAMEGQTMVVNDLSAKRQQRGGMLIGDSREPESAAYTPMIVEGKVIGLLELQSYRNHAYGEDDLDLLSMIANQIGLAIQNALLFSDVQQRLYEVELLQEVSKSLRQAQSMAEMIPVFIQHSLLAVGAQAGSIYLLDESSGDWVSTGWINTRGEWLARSNPLMRHRPGEGVTGFVGSSGEIYYTEDWRSDPITVIPPGEEQILSAYYSGISLPLRAEQRVIGVMHLWSEKRRSFSAEEQRLLLAIADMAGNALQRSRLYEETQRRMEQLNALQTVDRAISSSLDVHFSLDILLKQTITQLKVDAAGVLLYNPLTLALEYASGRGFRTREYEQSRLPMGKGLAGRAAFEQRMMLVPDLATNQTFLRRDFLEKEGFVSYAVAPLLAKGAVKGVLEIFHRSRLNFDSDWQNFMEGLALQAAIAIDNGQMFEGLQRTNLELSLAYDAAIEGWGRALDLRDRETENHTQRVTKLAVALARALGFNEQQMVHLRRGAILHDIGKMGIPDSILQKPGPLSAEEWEIMRRHPQFAYEMLSPIRYLRPALDIPYCHHERWDGSGYPQGLKGEEIPLAARLFAVVDVFDALTSNRPYRPAWPRAEAIAYLRQQAGKLFDPQIVAAFLKIIQAEGEQASPASN